MPEQFALIRWNDISRAIAQAQDMNDLNKLRGKVEAIRILAKQSKQSLETQNRIAEFRLRIDRKRGEWLLENIVQSGNGSNQHQKKELRFHRVTLANVGVTKKESFILQRIAKVPEHDFEKHLERQQKEGAELTTASVLKLETALKFSQRKSPPLPVGKFSVIYCDIPWKYPFSHSHIKKVEEIYPTMSLDEILEMGASIRELSAPDCVLFMWIPSAHLEKFPSVLAAWGFRYCTSWVWYKQKGNFSFYGSISHELIIIGATGSGVPTFDPKTAQSVSSVQSIRKTVHSAKPKEYYDIIEKLYPRGKYLELFSRCKEPRKGWTFWGDELPSQ